MTLLTEGILCLRGCQSTGLDLIPENYRLLIKTGMDIKRAVMQNDPNVLHPFEEDLSFLYGTIFIEAR